MHNPQILNDGRMLDKVAATTGIIFILFVFL